MPVNLTIDCVVSEGLLDLPKTSALAQLMAKGETILVESSLEALVCQQFGLQAAPDYPIAAIAASADGLVVSDASWFRADAVHLELQRDSFRLSEPAPLQLSPAEAAQMLASFNQHFRQDNLEFHIGNSGAWYVQLAQAPQISTSLPSIVIGKNIHPFMPQGADANKWRAVLNEVQMLLFEHPANVVRESKGELAVNSIWLSGGGVMPQKVMLKNEWSILASSPLYQGLAAWAEVPYQALPQNFEKILQSTKQKVRLQLPPIKHLDDVWFRPILLALKSKKISNLILHLGLYEKCLIVEVKPIDMYKFWRKTKSVRDYLS